MRLIAIKYFNRLTALLYIYIYIYIYSFTTIKTFANVCTTQTILQQGNLQLAQLQNVLTGLGVISESRTKTEHSRLLQVRKMVPSACQDVLFCSRSSSYPKHRMHQLCQPATVLATNQLANTLSALSFLYLHC